MFLFLWIGILPPQSTAEQENQRESFQHTAVTRLPRPGDRQKSRLCSGLMSGHWPAHLPKNTFATNSLQTDRNCVSSRQWCPKHRPAGILSDAWTFVL